MLTSTQLLMPTKKVCFFPWDSQDIPGIIPQNKPKVGTHSVNTRMFNGSDWLLLLQVSLILTFIPLAFLEGHLNGATLHIADVFNYNLHHHFNNSPPPNSLSLLSH